MAWGWPSVLAAALVFGTGGSALAQATPAERAREAAAMIAAAGFRIQGAQIVNACGRPAQPRPTAMDLNGDGRPEAFVTDVDPACHGGTGEAFVIIQKLAPFSWTRVGGGQGRVRALETRTNGWRDIVLEGQGCPASWTYQPRQGYLPVTACPGAATPVTGAAPPVASAADRAAAFKAAGFIPTRGKYLACDPRQEAEVEFRDLNGDGRLDAVVTNFGLECFGNTGQGWVLVTKEPSGTWRKVHDSGGIPDFLPTRGPGGWPDVVNGGPGFCFPVLRWNGQGYAVIRWKAEQPGACAGRR